MVRYEMLRFEDDDALAREAAVRWVSMIQEAARHGPSHHVALSGGRIARRFLAATAALALEESLTFRHVHFYWADERCVPPDDVESNYRLAAESFLNRVQPPIGQIHRIRGEWSPAKAAAQAEAELRTFLPAATGLQPELDLVILGMGEDGHVASLFPGAGPDVEEALGSYLAVRGPKPPPDRVTLSYAALAAARQVWVMVSGAGKEDILRASLSGAADTPLARVVKARRATLILTSTA